MAPGSNSHKLYSFLRQDKGACRQLLIKQVNQDMHQNDALRGYELGMRTNEEHKAALTKMYEDHLSWATDKTTCTLSRKFSQMILNYLLLVEDMNSVFIGPGDQVAISFTPITGKFSQDQDKPQEFISSVCITLLTAQV
jgi:hypothetical protein